MFLELRGEKWDHPASSRSINGSMPSIIEVFKTSSDERTSLSRIFHGRKGRSLVLKTGATLFPCKGRRGSNEGTERLGILHEEENVDPRITIMSLFVSTTGWSFTLLEEKPRLRRKVVFFLPFLFFFPFLFFSFLPSFFLSLSTFARERVFASHLARNDHSITFLPLFPLYLRIFFFFLQQMLRKNLPRRKIVARNYPLNFKIEFNLWSWRFLHIFFSFSFSFWQCVVRGCTPLEKESRDV